MKINRDLETEKFINELENKEIYLFMRSEYDLITNFGEAYDVEKHDELVAVRASEKFDISPEEAKDIYVKVEWKISEFYKERMKR